MQQYYSPASKKMEELLEVLLVPEIPVEYEEILKDGGGFWDDVNGGYLPEDHVLAARREEI